MPYRVNPDLDAARIATAIDTTFTASDASRRRHPAGLRHPGPRHPRRRHHPPVHQQRPGFAGIAYAARLLPVKSCFSYWDFQFFLSAARPTRVRRSASSTAGARPPTSSPASAPPPTLAPRSSTSASAVPGSRRPTHEAINYAVQRGAFVAMAVGNEFEDGNPVEYPAGVRPADSRAPCRSARSAAAAARLLLQYRRAPGDRRARRRLARERAERADLPDRAVRARLRSGDGHRPALRSLHRVAQARHVDGDAARGRAGGAAYSQGITSPAAIEAAITRFARDLGDAGTDPQYGAGLIDARSTLRGLGLAR